MRSEELVIRLRLPRLSRRWLIAAVIVAGGAVALAVPTFTDGTTLKASDLNALAAATVPSGAVMHFNLQACPMGWTEQVTARGRYLVGLPAGGTLSATAGTPLGDKEDRPTGEHAHAVTDPGHSHSIWPYRSHKLGTGGKGVTISGEGASDATSASATGITVNNFGSVAGTNAPYLQLLVCQNN